MRYLPYFKEKEIPENKAFDFFVSSMRPSIAGWDYFVDWDKVTRNSVKLKTELSVLDELINAENLKEKFIEKIKENPSITLTFPTLLAIRDAVLEVSELLDGKLTAKQFRFHPEAEAMIAEDYWDFFQKSGLAEMFLNGKIKSVSDYIFGVEVGLDSNGRKNRGGDTMEDLVESFIKPFCEQNNLGYLKEANAKKIKKEFGYEVPVDKSSRRYDFVIKLESEPLILETNFYGGRGSKLKSTAGEYRNLYDVLKGKFKFIWITDGAGWKTALLPLRETFDHNDYVFNLFMVEDGILEHFIKKDEASRSD